jgi:uncharacterized protein (DUF302 family)
MHYHNRRTQVHPIKTLILATSVIVLAASSAFAGEDWIIKQSPHDVSTTADRLVAVINKAGATVFARIDHQANAKKAGMEMAPATVVLFGNPKIGTPIMQANPQAAIDLPVKVLIWSVNGKTKIGALAPAALKARHAVEGADGSFKKMNGALNKLMGVAIAE